MRNLWRLLKLFAPDLPWLLFGTLLALASLAANVFVFTSVAALAGGFAAGFALRTLAASRVVARYAERLSTHDATFRVLARLRLWLFNRLIPLAPLQLGMQRGGDLLTRLTSDIDALDGFYLRFLLPLFLALTATLAGVWWLAQWNCAAAIALIAMLFCALLVLGGIAYAASQHNTALMQQQSELRTHVLDGIEGLAELTANSAGHQQAGVIARSTAALVREQLIIGRAQALSTLTTQLLHGMVIILLLALSWPLLISHSIAPITLVIALLGYMGGADLLMSVQGIFMNAPRLAAASQRIFEMADRTADITEPAALLPMPADTTLQLANVSFTYGREIDALSQINFTIKPHERVAIMGGSGAGKSTLALLLLKFAKPTHGAICVGGIDLAQLNGDDWRTHLGYLSQHTRLLAGSIISNLHLAAPTASEAELWAALDAVEMASFVRSLPQGLETWMGEDGLQLSGGQARRIALAMVVLKNARIWLLDEPTEGLDADTAAAVLATITRLTANRTLLLITHDPDSLVMLGINRLVLLESGKISADSPL